MKTTQRRFQFSLRLFVIASVAIGIGLGVFGRIALGPDEDYDQPLAPFSGLIELYDPQYGFIGLRYDLNGELTDTPFPGQEQTEQQEAIEGDPSHVIIEMSD